MTSTRFHEPQGSVELMSARERRDDTEWDRSYDSSDNDRTSQKTVVDRDSSIEENEAGHLLNTDGEQTPDDRKQTANMCSSMLWAIVNTLATIGIVFTNKAIFSFWPLKLVQVSFAAFHFFVTWLTLHTLSRPCFAFFVPQWASARQMIPLSIAMSLNVILPNFSLAYSTVTFYQVARILLTPVVALMNYVMYQATVPRNAILALVPACIGVGMVSYFDSRPTDDETIKTTSSLGVVYALAGIFASSLYTVWIASYIKKLKMTSMQLLYNQAPISLFLLFYVMPFVDAFPHVSEIPISKWILILLSGMFASLINISQFFIVAQTGPVSSTVVGHVKTCTIVALGWATSGRSVGDTAIIGVFIAIGGIIAYSIVMLKHNAQGGK